MVSKLLAICLALLVGIGLQYLMVGAMFMHTMDFASFTVVNWIFEAIYVIFLICLALKLELED
jgi:hypothetical protein